MQLHTERALDKSLIDPYLFYYTIFTSFPLLFSLTVETAQEERNDLDWFGVIDGEDVRK